MPWHEGGQSRRNIRWEKIASVKIDNRCSPFKCQQHCSYQDHKLWILAQSAAGVWLRMRRRSVVGTDVLYYYDYWSVTGCARAFWISCICGEHAVAKLFVWHNARVG